MRLDDLFDVKQGLASSNITLLAAHTPTSIPYIRPAKTQQRTVAGWVEKSEIPNLHRHPKHTIFVSTDGEGSHTYAYVSDFDFVANSNVSVLKPRREMSLQEKIFYAQAITLNRPKFSYGRKPKGDRLKSINLPDALPDWVSNSSLSTTSKHKETNAKKRIPSEASNKQLNQTTPLSELFDIRYGVNLELNHMEQFSKGINFVARTAKNNGVSARVQRLYDLDPISGGVLSVAGGGSVLETFLQQEPFYSGRDLYYLMPKVKTTNDELLFYATCIRANQYKYSYGRQANKTLHDLPVPVFNSLPKWINGTLVRVTENIELQIKSSV